MFSVCHSTKTMQHSDPKNLLSPEGLGELEEVEVLFENFFIRNGHDEVDTGFQDTCCYRLVYLKIGKNYNKYFIILNLQRHFHGKWSYLSIFPCNSVNSSRYNQINLIGHMV